MSSHLPELAASGPVPVACSCGWWWPGDDICVVVDRPKLVLAEPDPDRWHDEVRIREPISFRDGWSVAVR